jgi:hypothetical protein
MSQPTEPWEGAAPPATSTRKLRGYTATAQLSLATVTLRKALTRGLSRTNGHGADSSIPENVEPRQLGISTIAWLIDSSHRLVEGTVEIISH